MTMRVFVALVCLGVNVVPGTADEEPQRPDADRKALQGEWVSPALPSPGSPDGVILRTLEIGQTGKPDSVRLSWSFYCGRSRITGGDSFVGRLSGVEGKDPKRVLVLAGEKGARYEIEFKLSGDRLQLKGSVKDVDVHYEWTRKPAAKKE